MKKFASALLLFCCMVYGTSIATTLKDKIGQMLILGFDGTKVNSTSTIAKDIKKYNIGGVILFDYNMNTDTFNKNIETPQQLKRLNHKLQVITKKANHHFHRLQLPLLISIDYEGGAVNRLKPEYGFPETFSAEYMGKLPYKEAISMNKVMANTLKQSGVNLDFAPVLDVNVNADNPIISKLGRSFSDNPYIVARYGRLFSQELLKKHIQCAYKHFPGHGSSISDSHLEFVDVTFSWHEDELIPYQQSFNEPQHCGVIMTGHIVNRRLDATGKPATLSYPILTRLLRHQLHFDGVIITDDMQMKAITEHYGLEEALVLAINAGADMLLFGNQLNKNPQEAGELINIIARNVKSGDISEQRINEAYRRIIHLKQNLE